ncbi:MAG: GFA family protein [Myxococcota bacterium]
MTESDYCTGGCHCGRVRYRVRFQGRVLLDCNCSICQKKGILHGFVDPDSFELISGREALTTYTFNTHVAKHRFCSTCGVQCFYRPRSHPDQIDVNARTLDGFDSEEWDIRPFDGQNWEANVESIRK